MTVAELRGLFEEARPLVKQWLDLSEQFASFRTAATDKGFDWSQIKALLKAQTMDERDSTDKHVKRIVEKAEYASSYAAMLGLDGSLNEKNYSEWVPTSGPTPFDDDRPAAPVKAAAEEYGGESREGRKPEMAATDEAPAKAMAAERRLPGTAAPYPGDDDPLGPDLPAILVRHPAASMERG